MYRNKLLIEVFKTGLTTGKALSVKPSKIVAGQEPEKTNELLQCLALALDKKLSSKEAVIKVKENFKSPQLAELRTKENTKNTKKNNDSKSLSSKSSEKLITKRDPIVKHNSKNAKEKNTDNKIKKKENGQIKLTKAQPSKTQLQPSKFETKLNLQQKGNAEIKNTENRTNQANKPKESTSETDTKKILGAHHEFGEDKQSLSNEIIKDELALDSNIDRNDEEKLYTSYTFADSETNLISPGNIRDETTETEIVEKQNALLSDIPDNDKKSIIVNNDCAQIKEEQIDIIVDSNSLPQLEQTKQPVKLVKSEVANSKSPTPNTTTNTRPLSVRPSSSRPGAPRLREKLDNFVSDTNNVLLGKVHIITENTGTEEEEEGSLIIVEEQESESQSTNDTQKDTYLLQNEHGHLVQQILDSQKELSQVSGKTEIEWQFGVQKAKEAQHQEIEQLRFNIQALSRVANPLGKLVDHIQEDVEVMRQELQQWKNIYEEVSKKITKQKSLNEDSLRPLNTKLKQVEIDTEEKYDKICDMKILIHKNATKIEKLLSGDNVQ